MIPALADWIADPARIVPEAALREAARALLDTLGCMTAGAREDVVARARAAMDDAGAGASLGAAALVNGVAAHALDLDDYEIPGSTHPSAVLFAALLALAADRPVRLDRLLDAYVAGYETIQRVGAALGYGHYAAGWHATATIGPLGAAAAAARLLGLDAARTAHALALATSASGGLKAQFGTDAKPLHAGLAARGGLEAALLAAAGLAAATGIAGAPSGFLALYGTPQSPGPEAALAGLGATHAILVSPPLRKPWPCCAYAHRAIEAAQRIAATPGFAPSLIRAVTLAMPEPYARVVACAAPATPSEARFSVRYCVAATLVQGSLGPADFAPPMLRRASVAALAARIGVAAYALAPGLGDMSPAAPDSVAVDLADGRVLEQTIADVLGGAARPLGEDALRARFLGCGGTAACADAILAPRRDAVWRPPRLAAP
jgi:2-methylcitrate dehydratase PrpD